jgi:hypothetical protein
LLVEASSESEPEALVSRRVRGEPLEYVDASSTSSATDKAIPSPAAHAASAEPIDPAKASVLKLGKDPLLVANLPSRNGKEHVTLPEAAKS